MAIIGIGIDIVQISRIQRSIDRFGQRFIDRIFHPAELEFSKKRKHQAEFLAACFAVKEAALKALSDFPGRGIPWYDIYITHEPTGKPILHFSGKAFELSFEKQVNKIHVSISHDGDWACAQVILET